MNEHEMEQIRALTQGHSAKKNATQQGLSVKTLEGRRRRLLKKPNLDSIAELVQVANATGLFRERRAT